MLASARGVLRYRQTPRANTVRPYVPLPIGPVGRGLTPPGCRAITATLLLIANFKIIRRGRRPRRPVQPRTTTQLPGGVKNPPYEPTQKPSKHQKPQPRTIPRGVEDAAPYGLHVSWRLPGAGRCKHRPLQSEGRDIRPRRGQTERGEKA